jgi:lipopolysaccharide export LptBFGC system permease protein LptF
MEAGGLVLEAGQAAPVPDQLWTLRFARAELRLAPAAARVELDERSSPHLRDLIARMRGNGRSVQSERLVWLKRFTLPAMVPLLVVGAFAAGARTRRPGVVVAGFSAAWWVGLRLADKGVDLTGAGGAAALPMVLLVALTVMLWRTWRLA